MDLKSEYKVKSTNLRPGDSIIFYSDGIIENRGEKDSSPLKLAGLTAIIEASANPDIETMKKDILKGYLAHVGKVPRDDDATLVCVKLA
jgi:serine phosphatase RsbU (regulator of sigma subunit)